MRATVAKPTVLGEVHPDPCCGRNRRRCRRAAADQRVVVEDVAQTYLFDQLLWTLVGPYVLFRWSEQRRRSR